ncbi:hypothetical protein KP509_19G045700 [Ceratopteris richardii]|uniref:Uncharacterized protein n=1 Tax=Ceratopteris richardii TaxID=49495 RepID=A0A8T2SM27_CERRI|nr:hypothetical protein KP509_19G045700 [Ceratopteris richardii]
MDCDYEDKYVLMYGALEQDYNELREEATEVASLLQQAKENKLRLQAEVKFLKRRALTLRESMRTPDFFCSREPVSESSSKYISGSSRGSIGRMVSSADFQMESLNTQPRNIFSRAPSTPPTSSKHSDVVGVLKTPSKQTADIVLQSKRIGKRKISWQDDFSTKQ